MEGSVKYKYQRYAVISNGIGKIASFIIFVIIFVNVVLAFISQQFFALIPVLPLAAILFFIRPKKVFFDITAKHLWSGRAFGTVKAEKYHNFSDIDFLCIRVLQHTRGGLHFALFAVKKDNTAIYITQVSAAKLTKLCEVTYEVVQIIGNVPVIISVC